MAIYFRSYGNGGPIFRGSWWEELAAQVSPFNKERNCTSYDHLSSPISDLMAFNINLPEYKIIETLILELLATVVIVRAMPPKPYGTAVQILNFEVASSSDWYKKVQKKLSLVEKPK